MKTKQGQQPRIRVGIVLPQDAQDVLKMQVSQRGEWQLQAEGMPPLPLSAGEELQFFREGESIRSRRADGEERIAGRFEIVPKGKEELIAQSGTRVRGVVAGRDFHWQKKIDVWLPGTLHISVLDGHLFLINELDFEVYVACVATSEMGAACPEALLEAQTIAARSWLLAHAENKHAELFIDACNDDCCQRYQGTTFLSSHAVAAAQRTYGTVLQYGGEICDARYSKSCGGVMEAFENVWPGKPRPYLRVKLDAGEDSPASQHLENEACAEAWLKSTPKCYCGPDYVPESELSRYLGSVDEEASYFRWRIELAQDELTHRLNEKAGIDASGVLSLVPLRRGGSGRIIRLGIDYLDHRGQHRSLTLESEYAIRHMLYEKFLYSSAFYVEAVPGDREWPQKFILHGGGWGHGVGLCQIGALGMALAGHSAGEILSHYYVGAELQKLY